MSGHYFLVKVDALPYLSSSLVDHEFSTEPVGPEQSIIYHAEGPMHEPILVFGLGKVRFGHRINISVAEDLSAVDHDITSIRLSYLALTLLILFSAILLLGWDIKRSLHPLLNVRSELEDVSSGRSQSINVRVPDEIKPLAHEINRLLELLLRRLVQSRTAIGNLAHALKTPVSILFQIGDEPIFHEYPDLRQNIHRQIESIHHCIQRELKRARIAGERQVTAEFNPRVELTTLRKTMHVVYAQKQLNIRIHAPDKTFYVDREDMMEILGNLLDNACKWAKTQVLVEVESSNQLVMRVTDDGPGYSSGDPIILQQRGKRLDESVQGHGIGLSIVSDIIASYHGVLQINNSKSLGGVQATVFIPLPQRPS